MRKLLALALVVGPFLPGHVAPAAGAVVPECGPVTYTWGTKYATCDLDPPDVLHILGVTYAQCMNYGGTWGGYITLKSGQRTTICRNVDY